MASFKNIVKSEPFKIIITLALIFLAVQGGWLLLKLTLSTDVPVAYVPSRSMEPTLKVGDLVLIKGIAPHDIRLGDIIVFYVPNHYGEDSFRIVHRVVAIVSIDGMLGFETKGDNNHSSDLYRWGHIPESNIVGVVIYKVPYVGYLAIKLREPLGILLIILLICIFIALEVTDSRKKKQND